MARVDFTTTSDADFVRGFVLATRYPEWIADAVYVAEDIVDYGGKVWTAADGSQGATPGTDPAIWTATARPALDLDGSVLVYAIRRRASDAAALVAVRSDVVDLTASHINVTAAAAGAFTLAVLCYSSPVLRNALIASDYVHALVRIRADGFREEVWSGSIAHKAGPAR